MANIFIDGDEIARKYDVPVKIDTGLVNPPTGTPADLIDMDSPDNYQFAFKQNASTTTTATTLGNWETLLGWRMMNVYGGFAFDYLTPRIKAWGGDNRKMEWSEELAFKKDIEALQNQINDLKKQIGSTK